MLFLVFTAAVFHTNEHAFSQETVLLDRQLVISHGVSVFFKQFMSLTEKVALKVARADWVIPAANVPVYLFTWQTVKWEGSPFEIGFVSPRWLTVHMIALLSSGQRPRAHGRNQGRRWVCLAAVQPVSRLINTVLFSEEILMTPQHNFQWPWASGRGWKPRMEV